MQWRLDYPSTERAHRVYVALTNYCDRACPWCSTCSTPHGTTQIAPETLRAVLPRAGVYQVQLEGGEPTCHPRFFELVHLIRSDPRCERLVVSTHGAGLPRNPALLRAWTRRLGAPLTLKVSCNHHLIALDPDHVRALVALRDVVAGLGGDRVFVVNARVRSTVPGEGEALRRLLDRAGLTEHANVFPLQRYGFATAEKNWPLPAPPTANFTLVNPDGQTFGADLLARSEAMRRLP